MHSLSSQSASRASGHSGPDPERMRDSAQREMMAFCVAPEISTIVALLNAKFFAFVTCRRKNSQEHGGIKLNFS